MIDGLLPAEVICIESYGPTTHLGGREPWLHPAEVEAAARMSPARRRQYTQVRACAREAMSALGHPPAPLIAAENGAPRWPRGLVGSLTHGREYRAAAAAPSHFLRGLGIDVERDQPVPRGVVERFATPDERRRLDELCRSDQRDWTRLLFSAKESAFKAAGDLLGSTGDTFVAVSVHLSRDGTFRAFLGNREIVTTSSLSGRWVRDKGFVATAVSVPQPSAG